MTYLTIDDALSYVTNLNSDEPDFSYLTYYLYDLPVTDNTEKLFISAIKGDWEYNTYFI